MSPNFEQLVGHAVVNKTFREKLLVDPVEAVKAAGFVLTEEELQDLKANIWRFRGQVISDKFAQPLEADHVQLLVW